MKTVTFGCPHCGKANELAPGAYAHCRHCGGELHLKKGTTPPCLVCGCEEIYRHRDFNQKVGLFIIAVGVVLWIWLEHFWPMIAAAAIDLALFYLIPDVAICYRCKAHYRGFDELKGIAGFDLERHEHYRFVAVREATEAEAKAATSPDRD
ncbi:MAG: hypothetical protein AAGD14_15580 [Planctomycetota bacterium]